MPRTRQRYIIVHRTAPLGSSGRWAAANCRRGVSVGRSATLNPPPDNWKRWTPPIPDDQLVSPERKTTFLTVPHGAPATSPFHLPRPRLRPEAAAGRPPEVTCAEARTPRHRMPPGHRPADGNCAYLSQEASRLPAAADGVTGVFGVRCRVWNWCSPEGPTRAGGGVHPGPCVSVLDTDLYW